jgi:prolipoprotein diacylglyceryltransferase
MSPILRLGPLAIQTSGLLLIVAFVVALELVQRAAQRLGLNADDTYNLAYVAAIAGLVGARASFVAQYWPVYRDDLAGVFALTTESLSPVAGLGIALIVGYVYAQRKGLDNRRFLDALTPGLVVMTAAVALADLASGNGYGSPTGLPWAIELWNARRHPVQVYQIIAVVLSGVAVIRSGHPFDGAHFGLFLALYAGSRLVLEAFHGDSSALALGIRSIQVASLLVVIIALALLRRWAILRVPTSPRVRNSEDSGN